MVMMLSLTTMAQKSTQKASDAAEIERLTKVMYQFFSTDSVERFMSATDSLMALCRKTGDEVTFFGYDAAGNFLSSQEVAALVNHDEGCGVPVSDIAAALILADKSDVRRNRVQDLPEDFDIHDRVNYSVTSSQLKINQEHTAIKLKLMIDTRYGEIGEYFEIFMERMLLCRKAAGFLGLEFHLIINEGTLM